MKTFRLLAGALALGLAACGAVPPQPPDPAVAQRIATTCLGSGLFKTGIGLGFSLVPAGALPAQIIDAGVDQVCADPARFAGDIGTVEWLVKNTAGPTPPARPAQQAR